MGGPRRVTFEGMVQRPRRATLCAMVAGGEGWKERSVGERPASAFGLALRQWRALRGVSQLRLGTEAGISTRHLSFVETGRSRPSRGMVLRLAEALDVPLRERNALLAAAGFAPLYRRSALEEPELAPVARVLDFLLARHEPFPAYLVDRCWRMLRANTPSESPTHRLTISV